MTHALRLTGRYPESRRRLAQQIDGLCATDLGRHLDECKSSERRFAAGRDLFSLGERQNVIYRLTEGWVILYNLLEDGRRQILHFAFPGAVLAFVPGRVMTHSAQALTETVVGVIPYSNLYGLLDKHPEVGMQLAWLVGRDRGLAYDRLLSIGRHKARERVAHLLLELFIRCRMRWPSPQTENMHLPLTQEIIGDATGLTGVHVNRVLHDLRNEGILEFHYRRLRILNPDKLVDAAQVDPQVAILWMRDDLPNVSTADQEDDNDPLRATGSVRHPTRSQLYTAKGSSQQAHL